MYDAYQVRSKKYLEERVHDAYGRPLRSLRVSVTDKCNFDCIFCHREGQVGSGELSTDEILTVAEVLYDVGVFHVKLTGGEPLLRRDIVEIIEGLKNIGYKDVSLTTNGYLLAKYARQLKDAGLDRINVSLHSLKRDIFKKITNVDALDKVLEGVERSIEVGLNVCLNFVLLRGLNESEIWDITNFVLNKGIGLHIIELHPVQKGKEVFDKHYWDEKIDEKLRELGGKLEIRDLHYRPRYVFDNGAFIELVRPVNNPIFCAGCTRIRLTSDGFLKPCLMRDDGVYIRDILESSLSKIAKKRLILEKVKEVNRMRRPSTLWPLKMSGFIEKSPRIERISLFG